MFKANQLYLKEDIADQVKEAINTVKQDKPAEKHAFNLDPKIVESRTNKKKIEQGDQLKKNQEARKAEEMKREKQENA